MLSGRKKNKTHWRRESTAQVGTLTSQPSYIGETSSPSLQMSCPRHLPTLARATPFRPRFRPRLAAHQTSNLSPLPRGSCRGQRSGRYFGRVSCGRSHRAPQLAIRKPWAHHTREKMAGFASPSASSDSSPYPGSMKPWISSAAAVFFPLFD